MKYIYIILLATLVFSCKSKQKLVAPQEVATTVSDKTVENIITNHNAVNRNFTTAYITASVDYSDKKQSLGLNADIRMKKNEIILVSVKMLGITMAKALITPDKVQYYEKLNSQYFEGDYKMLSDWLGTELDFQKVQNMLIGQAMDDLTKGKYKSVQENNLPRLDEENTSNFLKNFIFNPDAFTLNRQEIKQTSPERKLLVNYSNYKSYSEAIFPTELAIFALQDNETTTIGIQYKDVKFNQELTYPYSVPSGYERITIK